MYVALDIYVQMFTTISISQIYTRNYLRRCMLEAEREVFGTTRKKWEQVPGWNECVQDACTVARVLLEMANVWQPTGWTDCCCYETCSRIGTELHLLMFYSGYNQTSLCSLGETCKSQRGS